MAIKQLTVFVPNRKGTIVAVTDILAKNSVNIRALSIAETEDFGILRLIVNDEMTAEKTLSEEGYLIKVTDVVGVKIGDAPGKLTNALAVLDKAGRVQIPREILEQMGISGNKVRLEMVDGKVVISAPDGK